jgi:hypothetical protein
MASFIEDKFLVLPTKYLDQLSTTNKAHLNYILNRIKVMREEQGKTDSPKYFVCNQDEPYANDVLNTILLGEERKERDNER